MIQRINYYLGYIWESLNKRLINLRWEQSEKDVFIIPSFYFHTFRFAILTPSLLTCNAYIHYIIMLLYHDSYNSWTNAHGKQNHNFWRIYIRILHEKIILNPEFVINTYSEYRSENVGTTLHYTTLHLWRLNIKQYTQEN